MRRYGPDAARYMLAADGHRVARPFNLRWLLPAVCGTDLRMWWGAWALSWPLAAGGAFSWAAHYTDGWLQPTLVAALVVALPGLWGPPVVRPVGVDLPAMALTLAAAALWVHGYQPIAWVLLGWAAATKETQPIWMALWVWHPAPLVALVVPAVIRWRNPPTLDAVTTTPNLRAIHDHPIRTAWEAHAGRWRDAWLWVAPWGACIAGLWAITPQWVATMATAHLQVLVATDTVRLVHTAAGPVAALTAIQALPPEWAAPSVALGSVFWWRTQEVI